MDPIDAIPMDEIPTESSYDNEAYDNEAYNTYDNETSYIDDDPGSRLSQQRAELVEGKIKDLEKQFSTKIPITEYNRFRLSSGYLQVEKNPGEFVNVTKYNGKFLASSTLRARLGASLAHTLLEIETPTSLKIRSRLILENLPTEIEMDDLSPKKIDEIIEETRKSIGTNTDLDMREFLGIDKALTRIKGELENNASKLSEIDVHLKKEQGKLAEIQDDPEYSDELRKRIKNRIAELKEERKTRMEIASQNRKELASQFSRIRQTIEKILDEDLSLREKIKLVFREHGLTITAVLTSLGLIISTIITSLTGAGGSSGGSSTPPKIPNKLKDWVKNKLKALARLLGRLAGKAAAALPGIIGSIIAGVLNFLKKVVTTAAEHVWLFLTSIATLIGYRIFYPPYSLSRAARRSKVPNRKKR